MSDNKFFGIYRGVCVDIADPLKKNRVRLKVPQILGDETSDWAFACLPVVINGEHGTTESLSVTTGASGASSTGSDGSPTHSHTMAHTHNVTLVKHHTTPKINQGVWVMFEGGDPNFPIWLGVF